MLAEEGAAHAQNVGAVMDLSRRYQENLTEGVHARAAGVEPDTLEGVTHTQPVDVELDLIRGEVADRDMNIHAS